MTKEGKGGKRSALSEFEIIARYFAPLATDPAALSLLDDTAVLPVPEGQELIATTDTVIEGVHFLAGDPPDSIGHKALAVTLSDLAAKGARPYAYLLSLALPEAIGSMARGLRPGSRRLAGQIRHLPRRRRHVGDDRARHDHRSPRSGSCRKATRFSAAVRLRATR